MVKYLSGCAALVALLNPFALSASVDDLDGGVPDEPMSDGGVDEMSETPVETDGDEDVGADDDWGDDESWGEDEGWDDAGSAGTTASPKVSIHGLFENQLQGMWLRKDGGNDAKGMINDYTKLRVELSADLAGDVSLKADGVARIFAGETEVALTHLLPRKTREAVTTSDPRWAPFFEEPYRYDNDYYVNNAYLKLPVGPLVIFIGKQPLEQGVGYVWNPTDVFIKKDLFDPTYEKPGIIALRVKAALGDRVNLDLVGVPKDDFKNWIGGGRASIIAGPLRLSAAGYVTTTRREDLESSLDAMQMAALAGQDPESAVITHRGRRMMLGGEAVLDIEGVRLWTEGAYNFIEDKEGLPDDYLEVVGGVEYFFKTETHVMAEYLHYGESPEQQGGFYRLNDWMSVLSGDLKMLGQDFLFESVDHPVADFWTLGLSSFQSLSDASAAIMGDAKWQFKEDAELWLLVSYAAGQPDDFFSSARGQAWLRLTAYF